MNMEKKALIFTFVLMAMAGCSGGGFTSEESVLIAGGESEAMRVLKSDVPEDLAVLRRISSPVTDKMMTSDEYDLLCKRMLVTVRDPENEGVGIAAPQVGISRRLIAVQRFDKEGNPFEFYANPEIVRYSGEKVPGGEGCLSVPSLRGVVRRTQKIDLRYRTAAGKDTLETISGFTAVIFQHEVDHLDGVLYSDLAEVLGNEHLETRSLDGGAKMTWIQDNAAPRNMPARLFQDADPALLENFPEGIPSSVSVFLLEKGGQHILFDAGNGTEGSRLPAALQFLGLSADDIEYVCITHLHGDHIGGLLNGEEAAFPKAELYISKEEQDGWMNMSEERNALQRKLAAAYEGKIHLFNDGDLLPGEVKAISAHGHTPGHTVFQFGKVLVVGDILHGAALQFADPEICATFDMDKPAAIQSRKRILEYASTDSLLMCGMHFPSPAFI